MILESEMTHKQTNKQTNLGGDNGSEAQKRQLVVAYHTLSILQTRRKTRQQDTRCMRD
jgi:hypothetical protein